MYQKIRNYTGYRNTVERIQSLYFMTIKDILHHQSTPETKSFLE